MKLIAALTIFSLCLATAGYPQDIPVNTPGWNSLKSIPIGKQLQVTTKEGNSINGKLNKITDTSLALTTKKGSFSFQSIEVAQVYVLGRRPVVNRTVIGALAGAGAGGAIGYIVGKDDNWFGPGFVAAIFAGLGFVFGSVTGFLLGLSKKKALVYEAKPAR